MERDIVSRTAPTARDAPPPMVWTPSTSRAAMPAMTATTESAMVVLPPTSLRRLETAILSQPLIQAVSGRLKELA